MENVLPRMVWMINMRCRAQPRPFNEDSDFDGLNDGQEVKYTFPTPYCRYENDSINESDGIEVNTSFNTNPLIADSDYELSFRRKAIMKQKFLLTNPNTRIEPS